APAPSEIVPVTSVASCSPLLTTTGWLSTHSHEPSSLVVRKVYTPLWGARKARVCSIRNWSLTPSGPPAPHAVVAPSKGKLPTYRPRGIEGGLRVRARKLPGTLPSR